MWNDKAGASVALCLGMANPSQTRQQIERLLLAEEARSESRLVFLRFAVVLGYAASLAAFWALIPDGERQSALFGTGLLLVSTTVIGIVLVWNGYRPFLKYVSTAVDVAAFSVWVIACRPFFGGEIQILYLGWVVLAVLRFSLPLTITAVFLSTVSLALLTFLVLPEGNPIDAAAPGSSWMSTFTRIFLLLTLFGLCIFLSALVQNLITRAALVREMDAERGKEDRITANLEFSEKRMRMLESFSRFVPEQFLEFLGRNIVEVKLGDAVAREITLVFADIRNFAAFAEKMSAEDTFKFLNAYLRRMGPVIHKSGGFIDKFIGDEIMALFTEEPDAAVTAAASMIEQLKTYNRHRDSFGYEPIRIGIGIHMGPVMLGTVGSDFRLDTTVIGDTVNLAASLQNLTKIFHVPIIVSDAVFRRLSDPSKFHFREIDSVRVRGKENPIVLYELYDADEPEMIQMKDASLGQLGMAMYQYKAGNFEDAKIQLEECLKICPEDPIPKIYIRRCDYLLTHPPRNWSGVSRMR